MIHLSLALLAFTALLGLPAGAQTTGNPDIRLVPQELYGQKVLELLDERGKDGVRILQFNFFTDNRENSYPKRIAQKLLDLKQQHPDTPVVVALESRKDADAPDGRGAAQRNAKTKKRLSGGNIDVRDVYGNDANHGVTHTKLVMVGNTAVAGSSNLTMQSTNVGANNEMNLAIDSEKISGLLREYFDRVVAEPGKMTDLTAEDGPIRVLTDRLHFNELIEQIRAAKKGDQLGLSMYQFLYRNENDAQAKHVLAELIQAHERGAVLEVYLNRAADPTTQNTSTNLRVAELLLQAGVKKVYLDPEAKISHSKFLYRITGAEKVAMVSSVNIYRGDFNDNHQLTWIVKDHPVVDQLVTYFKHQIAYDGVPASQVLHQAPAPRMLRFWRGFKQDPAPQAEFERQVNARLIPETIEVGGGRGLNAYLPSFYPAGKPAFLPDEVAVIDYANEEQYNALRTTERGRKYGPLHFEKDLFARANAAGFKSGSLLGQPYSGQVELSADGRAYLIGEADVNWQDGVTVRRTLLPATELTAAGVKDYLNAIRDRLAQIGIRGMVAVVDPAYLILMVNLQEAASAQALDGALAPLESGRLRKFDQIRFERQSHGSTRLEPGAGINVQFDPALKSREQIVQTVLEEISRFPCAEIFR